MRTTGGGNQVAGHDSGHAAAPPATLAADITRHREAAASPVGRETTWWSAAGVPVPSGLYARFGKPLLDRVVAVLLLAVLSPLILVIAIAVRADVGTPVLFRQRRVGRDGEVFSMVKFRSMRPDRRSGQADFDGADRRRTHKHPEDPRLTAFGRFLRSWSLDELPQLLHVVRGEMSLVGPRPELVSVVAGYEPWQHARHLVKPGLTGLWQVTERGSTPMHERTDLDLEYLRRLSLWTDLSILLRTVPAALGGRRGA